MPQLVYNNSYNSKDAYNNKDYPTSLDSFINYFIEKDSCSAGILVVPTRKYVNYIKKYWIKKYFKYHNKAVGKFHIYNLIDFAKLCLQEISNEPINMYSDAVLLSIMEEAMISTDLFYYSNKNSRVSQNILEKIFNIIDGLRKDGITIDNMNSELEVRQSVSSAEKRFNDVANIYKRYVELLKEKANNKFDETGIYEQLKNKKNNYYFSFIKPESIIYFHNFTEFKQPEAEFVALFNDFPTPTFVNIDYSKLAGPEIHNLPNNIRRLIRNEMNNNLRIDNETEIVAHIKKWLFNENNNLYKKELKNQIKIYETKDRINEVKSIVKLAVHLHKENGIPFAEMCVCSRQSNIYSELFREYFSESGIVVNISDRYDLASATPIIILFSLLDVIISKWKRASIEKLQNFDEIKKYIENEVKNGNIIQENKSKIGGSDNFSINILILIAQKYRITGGWDKNNWLKSLNKVKKIIDGEVKDGNLNIIKLKEQQNILIALNTFNKLLELLDFSDKNTFNNYSNSIKKIINSLEISKNIYKEAKKIVAKKLDINKFQLLEEIEKKSRALETFNDLLDELSEIEGDKEYYLMDFIAKLRTAVSSTKYQLSEKDNLGINITSIEQTRGIPYRVLILCGAIEGEFPMAFRTDKFLGKELKDSEVIHYDNEKILFYKFLTNNANLLEKGDMELYIFYPNSINSVKTIRSSFVDDVCNIIDKEQVSEHIVNLGCNSAPIWNNYITTNLDIISNASFNKNIVNNKYLSTLKDNNLDVNKHKNIKETLKDNIYSVSQLETFAECGLKYFYKYIIRLKDDTKTEDYSFSALDLGNYFHKILQEFYENIKIKYNMTDIKEYNDELLNELLYIADNHLKNYSEMPLFVYEIIKIKNILRQWFVNEIEKQNGGWKFVSNDFELKFGYNNEIALKTVNDTLKIKGSIDRVEINNETKEYIIADYKLSTNSVKKESDVLDGKALQLPLYLLSLQQISKYNDFMPYNGVYYVFNTDKNMTNWIIKKSGIDILDIALDNAVQYKNKIEQLSFQPINYNIKKDLAACNNCSYKQFCRITDKIKLHL